jgi:hypothetical protein
VWHAEELGTKLLSSTTMVLYQVLLILSPQVFKNIPHTVVRTDSGRQELQQDRQMQAHMHTVMYTETVMAGVICFDSRTAEIASVKK